ncbi:hypothetical protein [Streptacidiphilus albus]|uniref:hypothetical protein n=1 Tax=Streptacidiphilus albus TaxID=105425 RepID=UPI0012E04247|nr:hypothetical protein [Streptacidiphilus albus]
MAEAGSRRSGDAVRTGTYAAEPKLIHLEAPRQSLRDGGAHLPRNAPNHCPPATSK